MDRIQDNPLVSIVTVVFNGEDFIEETIKSVLSQTYQNIEYIIVDGGSTDGTIDIIKKYEDKISHWISEPEKGIYDAMNKGIDLANGEWCNFLNAGDSFVDEKVLEQIFTKNINDSTLIYGDIIAVKEDGMHLPVSAVDLVNDSSIKKGMKVCHQAIFYHKNIMENYDSELRLKSEWKHLVHMTRHKLFKPMKFNFPFVYYSVGGIGAQQIQLNHSEYKKVFLDEYGNLQYIKFVPYFTYMSARIFLKKIFRAFKLIK